MILDGDKLLADIEEEVRLAEQARDDCFANEWYAKVSQNNIKAEAINYVRMMIARGDYTIG